MPQMREGPSLVIVGHIAYDEIRTPQGRATVTGGAAYYAACAAALVSGSVGIVSAIGPDVPLNDLDRLGVDTRGLQIRDNGRTPRFVLEYTSGDVRSLRADLGTANEIDLDAIPPSYLATQWLHVATNVPQQQRRLLSELRRRSSARRSSARLSVDSIEAYVEAQPEDVRAAFRLADLAFLNLDELRLLGSVPSDELIVKMGARGAEYRCNGMRLVAPALPRLPLDPTGAGDVLAGAFLALRANDVALDDCLRRAVDLAGQATEGFGIEALLHTKKPAGARRIKRSTRAANGPEPVAARVRPARGEEE